MFKILFILFITVPIIELFVFLKLADYIGIGYTLFLVILTGVIGVALTRHQGFSVSKKILENLNQGVLPGNQLLESLLILIGAALLLTPGFMTDIVGLSLLVPYSRRIFREVIKIRLKHYIETGAIKLIIK